MIENILLTIIAILMILILILLIGIIYILFSKRNINPVTANVPYIEPQILEDQETCIIHKDKEAETLCVICEDYFCKSCLKIIENHALCQAHLKIFMSTSWTEIKRVESDANHPELGVALVERKRQVWKDLKIPMYLETQYKIDVDHDRITSFLVLYGNENSKVDILSKFE